MVQRPKRIITSLLDTDAYKIHMQQAVYHLYPSVHATFEFVCRDADAHLGDIADAVREQVQLMKDIALASDEYDYLATRRFIQKDYLDWLRGYRFNPEHVTVDTVPANDWGDEVDLAIRIDGPWVETILWEVPLLAVVSELAHRRRTPHIGVTEALAHLEKKIDDLFSTTPPGAFEKFHVVDFGTRRRYSFDVHAAVVATLHSHEKFSHCFWGTSNYLLAKKMNVAAVGTQAHEWFQAHQQLAPLLRDSQRLALMQWIKEYPCDLLIALTDCITMDTFLQDFTKDLADVYIGLRNDSGDPLEWGRKAVQHYIKLGIDPKQKTLVFSDSLDLQKAMVLHQAFKDKCNVMCGIGTQLSCSIPGVQPLNIVIKMTGCEGKPVAKLSDTPGKSTCRDKNFLRELQRAFDLPAMADVTTAAAAAPEVMKRD